MRSCKVLIQIIGSQVSNNEILGCSLKRCYGGTILSCLLVTFMSFQHNICVLSEYIYIFSYPHSLFRSMMTNAVTKSGEKKTNGMYIPF